MPFQRKLALFCFAALALAICTPVATADPLTRLSPCAASELPSIDTQKAPHFTFVTGSESKWSQFSKILSDRITSRIARDLVEADADPLTVIVHKASQIPESSPDHVIFVADTSLHVEGTDLFGINVKWHVGRINEFVGNKAEWQVHVAFRHNGFIHVAKGSLRGIISERQSEGPGFGPFFVPDGHSEALTVMDYRVSARRNALENLFKGDYEGIFHPMETWDGPLQEGSG